MGEHLNKHQRKSAELNLFSHLRTIKPISL